jgi:excisionase family DNA binding protein
MSRNILPTQTASPTDEELLELYLTLPRKKREERFISTAQTAELTGLSVRTIQFWIESGLVRAVSVGKKYRVDTDSLREYLSWQIGKRVR